MSLPGVVPPKPIPLKERAALVFIERAQLDVKDGAFVAINADGTRTHIPVGGIACLMLEPGARISHSAVALAARAGTLVTWVGEAGVRLYAAGQPGGARSDKLLWQASLALDPAARLRVVREMYRIRFGEAAPLKRSIDQLRGIEGARVRASYDLLARQHGVTWKRRRYDPADWDASDIPNRCLSAATALPARACRSGGAGRRIRTRYRLPAYRKAPLVRLRHRGPVEDPNGGPGGVPPRRQGTKRQIRDAH